MKVILLQDIKGIGKKWDTKDIKDGYVRNFLIPHKLAVIATEPELKKLEKRKREDTKEKIETEKKLREIAALLKERSIEFQKSADEAGTLFGSINKEEILKALREQRILGTERIEILLDHPIKKIGEYTIPFELGQEIKGELKIIVRSQS